MLQTLPASHKILDAVFPFAFTKISISDSKKKKEYPLHFTQVFHSPAVDNIVILQSDFFQQVLELTDKCN